MSNSFNGGLTRGSIDRNPLPQPARQAPDRIARWIASVVPCLAPQQSQSAEVAEAVVAHLRKNGVSDANIAAALDLSHDKWTLPMKGEFMSLSVLMRANELMRDRNSPQATMGPAGKLDLAAMKLKAAELDAKYMANAHSPGVQNELVKALIDLLGSAGEAFHDMQKDKERIKAVQQEILANSRNIAPIIRYVGPLELHRMRQASPPNRPGVPYAGPSLVRTVPRTGR